MDALITRPDRVDRGGRESIAVKHGNPLDAYAPSVMNAIHLGRGGPGRVTTFRPRPAHVTPTVCICPLPSTTSA